MATNDLNIPRYSEFDLFVVETVVLGSTWGKLALRFDKSTSYIESRYRVTRRRLLESGFVPNQREIGGNRGLGGVREDRRHKVKWLAAVNMGRVALQGLKDE